MRALVTVLFIALSAPLFAQSADTAVKADDAYLANPSVLKTKPVPKKIGDLFFADIQKSFVLKTDVIVLDPDDPTSVIEPGEIFQVQVGKKGATPVWLKLKLLDPPSEEDVNELMNGASFEALLEQLRKSDVTTQICRPGEEGMCVKTCVTNGKPWCCKKKC